KRSGSGRAWCEVTGTRRTVARCNVNDSGDFFMRTTLLAAGGALAVLACPALAQESEGPPPPEQTTVYDGDRVTVGAGAVYAASYDGSDDYVIFPVPMVMGQI